MKTNWMYPSDKKRRWSEEELQKYFCGNMRTSDMQHRFYIRDTHGGYRVISLDRVMEAIFTHCGIYLDYEEGTCGHMTVKEHEEKK